MGTPTYEQRNFRFRNDDGSEAAATWPVIINTDITQDPTDGSNKRLRLDIFNDNATKGTNIPVAWEYSYEAGTWTPITAVSSYIRGYDSSFLTDGEDCTQQISAGVFLVDNNGVTEDGVLPIIVTWARNEVIETELSYYIVDADVVPTDTIDVRAVLTGYTVTYTNTPQIVVTAQRRITIGHA